jgi:hypothetical protein
MLGFSAAKRNPMIQHLSGSESDGLGCFVPMQTAEEGLANVGFEKMRGDKFNVRAIRGDTLDTYLWRKATTQMIVSPEMMQLVPGMAMRFATVETSPDGTMHGLFRGTVAEVLGDVTMEILPMQPTGVKSYKAQAFNRKIRRFYGTVLAATRINRGLMGTAGSVFTNPPASAYGEALGVNFSKVHKSTSSREKIRGQGGPAAPKTKKPGVEPTSVRSGSLRHKSARRGPKKGNTTAPKKSAAKVPIGSTTLTNKPDKASKATGKDREDSASQGSKPASVVGKTRWWEDKEWTEADPAEKIIRAFAPLGGTNVQKIMDAVLEAQVHSEQLVWQRADEGKQDRNSVAGEALKGDDRYKKLWAEGCSFTKSKVTDALLTSGYRDLYDVTGDSDDVGKSVYVGGDGIAELPEAHLNRGTAKSLLGVSKLVANKEGADFLPSVSYRLFEEMDDSQGRKLMQLIKVMYNADSYADVPSEGMYALLIAGMILYRKKRRVDVIGMLLEQIEESAVAEEDESEGDGLTDDEDEEAAAETEDV